MNSGRITVVRVVMVLTYLILSSVSGLLYSLDPPTREQIEKYKSDGTLEARVEQAKSYGNHLMSPQLISRLKEKLELLSGSDRGKILSPPPGWKGMPTTGNVRIPVLLISFADTDNVNSPGLMKEKIFGKGKSAEYPLESLTEFYYRSSYGQLRITGNILGWYKFPGPRSEIEEDTSGRENLIKQALMFHDSKGHDFSQYDNDQDGDIDYLVVIWSGKHGEWSSFWWAYQTSFYDRGYKVDGKSLSLYSWQWESRNYPNSEFSVSTLIHETGHALGLPDLYDYQEGIGPEGGVGGMDIMDAIWGDHNGFHKFMLDWTSPRYHPSGTAGYTFEPAVDKGESLIIMPDINNGTVFGEFFMVENRWRKGNDIDIPNDGLIIWHIDSTLNRNGRGFEFDNSNTLHKYVRLMEADGLEEIEMKLNADSGDFFTYGDTFGPGTTPGSLSHDGDNTGIIIKDINPSDDRISFQAAIDVPVEIELSGERKQESAWIVVSDFADLNVTFQEKADSGLYGFRIMKKYGLYEYEDHLTITINELSGNTFSIKDSDIEKKAVYRYKVIAVDNAGNILGISREIKI